MFTKKFHGYHLAGWLVLSGATALAGNFAVPADGAVAFRRDKIPLDVDAMANLSRQLVTLAQGLDSETAANRHTAAQMLALATALDPANVKARDLISEFQNDKHHASTDAEQLAKSQARIWQLLSWLESPDAGAQGQALAACLTDVIIASDPQHPRAEALRAAGERGAWTGWVPAVSAYETPVIPQAATPDDAAGPVPEIVKSGILLSKGQVLTPLWKPIDKSVPTAWVLTSAPLEMSAGMIEEDKGDLPPFSLTIGPPDNTNKISQLRKPLLQILKNQKVTLPAGGYVTISGAALEASLLTNKRQSISAAAFVLTSAALSGREPEATIIGTVDETGAFKLPTGFWDQLRSLGPGKGRRLVLPAAAAELLPSMLALEKPQFFLDYEVLLASNVQELLELTLKSPAEPLAKASAQFQEIRDKAGSQAVGQYVANPFVRRRLSDLALEAPYHYSAKMLAIQAAGNRPSYILRVVLASELRRAAEPMAWIVKLSDLPGATIDTAQLSSTYDSCSTHLAQLLRSVAKDDRELVAHVQDAVTAVRTLDRAAHSRGDSMVVMAAISSAHAAFVRTYKSVTEELGREAGDPEPPPAP